jgi:hypothetical protein
MLKVCKIFCISIAVFSLSSCFTSESELIHGDAFVENITDPMNSYFKFEKGLWISDDDPIHFSHVAGSNRLNFISESDRKVKKPPSKIAFEHLHGGFYMSMTGSGKAIFYQIEYLDTSEVFVWKLIGAERAISLHQDLNLSSYCYQTFTGKSENKMTVTLKNHEELKGVLGQCLSYIVQFRVPPDLRVKFAHPLVK